MCLLSLVILLPGSSDRYLVGLSNRWWSRLYLDRTCQLGLPFLKVADHKWTKSCTQQGTVYFGWLRISVMHICVVGFGQRSTVLLVMYIQGLLWRNAWLLHLAGCKPSSLTQFWQSFQSGPCPAALDCLLSSCSTQFPSFCRCKMRLSRAWGLHLRSEKCHLQP